MLFHLRQVKEYILSHLFMNRERGQGLIEYALIVVLIAVAVIVILRTTGAQITNVFVSLSEVMPTP